MEEGLKPGGTWMAAAMAAGAAAAVVLVPLILTRGELARTRSDLAHVRAELEGSAAVSLGSLYELPLAGDTITAARPPRPLVFWSKQEAWLEIDDAGGRQVTRRRLSAGAAVVVPARLLPAGNYKVRLDSSNGAPVEAVLRLVD